LRANAVIKEQWYDDKKRGTIVYLAAIIAHFYHYNINCYFTLFERVLQHSREA